MGNPELDLSNIHTYIDRQFATRVVVQQVEQHVMKNFVAHGAQSLVDGTDAQSAQEALADIEHIHREFQAGRGTWVDAIMRHVCQAYATESLPQLRWALVKLASRTIEWIVDIDRRLLESRRVAPLQPDPPDAPSGGVDVPVIPGDKS